MSFGTSYAKSVALAVYRNVDLSSPIDVTSSNTASPGATVTAPSVTPTRVNDRLVMVTGANGHSGTWTTPTGMTAETAHTGGATDVAVFDQQLSSTTATGTRASTHSGSNTNVVGVVLALKPGVTSYGYDSQGNRTTVAPPVGSATTLGYDQANRLKSYGSSSTYAYNGDGLRTSKTVSGATTQFTWDVAEGLPLAIVDGTNNFIYGPGGLPLERIDNTGAVVYYHHDQLGSTRALTNSSGTVVGTYTYDSYGKPAGSTGSVTQPFGYAGQYSDTETGFQYLRAR